MAKHDKNKNTRKGFMMNPQMTAATRMAGDPAFLLKEIKANQAGLRSLSKESPETVREMGYDPATAMKPGNYMIHMDALRDAKGRLTNQAMKMSAMKLDPRSTIEDFTLNFGPGKRYRLGTEVDGEATVGGEYQLTTKEGEKVIPYVNPELSDRENLKNIQELFQSYGDNVKDIKFAPYKIGNMSVFNPYGSSEAAQVRYDTSFTGKGLPTTVTNILSSRRNFYEKQPSGSRSSIFDYNYYSPGQNLQFGGRAGQTQPRLKNIFVNPQDGINITGTDYGTFGRLSNPGFGFLTEKFIKDQLNPSGSISGLSLDRLTRQFNILKNRFEKPQAPASIKTNFRTLRGGNQGIGLIGTRLFGSGDAGDQFRSNVFGFNPLTSGGISTKEQAEKLKLKDKEIRLNFQK
jgi:hypothetical protein